MDKADAMRSARQPLIDLLAEKSIDLRPLIQGILYFDKDLNETTDIMAIIMGATGLDTTRMASSGTSPANSARVQLRPDEFTGKTYFESAKAYLERVGHAISMEDLLDALKKGGSPVGGKSPKKTLYISLVRSREFLPIPGQTGFIGLRKWYPNLRGKEGTDKKQRK